MSASLIAATVAAIILSPLTLERAATAATELFPMLLCCAGRVAVCYYSTMYHHLLNFDELPQCVTKFQCDVGLERPLVGIGFLAALVLLPEPCGRQMLLPVGRTTSHPVAAVALLVHGQHDFQVVSPQQLSLTVCIKHAAHHEFVCTTVEFGFRLSTVESIWVIGWQWCKEFETAGPFCWCIRPQQPHQAR